MTLQMLVSSPAVYHWADDEVNMTWEVWSDVIVRVVEPIYFDYLDGSSIFEILDPGRSLSATPILLRDEDHHRRCRIVCYETLHSGQDLRFSYAAMLIHRGGHQWHIICTRMWMTSSQ